MDIIKLTHDLEKELRYCPWCHSLINASDVHINLNLDGGFKLEICPKCGKPLNRFPNEADED